MLILGQGALTRPDGAAILALARKIAEGRGMIDPKNGWNGFNLLHTAAARVGGLDLGFVPGKDGLDTAAILDAAGRGDLDMVFLLGADEIDRDKLGKAFVVYQGHHGDAGAARADVILPGAAYTEKNATYVNTEGRVQRGRLAAYPPGEAREDWKIIRALSEVLGKPMAFNSLPELRQLMVESNPVFESIDALGASEWSEFGTEGDIDGADFRYPIDDFYRTDPISRASIIMAKCSEEFVTGSSEEAKKVERTGTDA
jgi:NADH-quinone oxidoreductase subunit G